MVSNSNVIMENVDLLPPPFRNFTGREGMYNREGDRNFTVLLPDDLAHAMAEDGWNVHYLKPMNEGDPDRPSLAVSVKYGKGRPPRVVLITSRGRTTLTEAEVEFLDWVDIRKADMMIRPYHWNVSGKSGIKAYLQSIFVTIEEDPLELKYADVQEINELPARPRPLEIEAGDGTGDLDIVDAEIIDED